MVQARRAGGRGAGAFVVLGVGAAPRALRDLGLALSTGAKYVLGRGLGPVLGFFVLLASAALNLITPTARVLGGLMRARYFARSQGRPFSLLYGVVLYDQVAHHAVMSVCTWIVLIAGAFVIHRAGLGFLAAAALLVSLPRCGPLEPAPGAGGEPARPLPRPPGRARRGEAPAPVRPWA